MPALPSPRSPHLRGVMLLVGAALAFSIMSVLVKEACRELPVEMALLARCVVTLVVSWVQIRVAGLHPWGRNKPLLVTRALLGTVALAAFFTAVTRLPLTEVTVIHYLNPLLAAILAAWLLGEKLGWGLAVALALNIAGTLLVTRPALLFGESAGLDPLGIAAALLAALTAAFAYVVVRRLTREDDPVVIVFYFPLVATPIILPFALRVWVWPSPLGWVLMLAIGLATQTGQLLLTRGLALVPAGRGTAVGYVQIAFAALWSTLFFDTVPGLLALLGGALIALGTLTLMRGK